MWLMTRDTLIDLSNIRSIIIEKNKYMSKGDFVELDGGYESGGFDIYLDAGDGGYFIKGLAKLIRNNTAEDAVYAVEEVIKIGKKE